MKQENKRIRHCLFVCLALVLLLFSGCTVRAAQMASTNPDGPQPGQLRVVTTLFPQYDFVRQIAGDHAHVSLLLPLGTESHSYEPSPADVIAISEADLFVYTGDYMEGWVSGILESVGSDLDVVDVSYGIPLDAEDHDHETSVHDASDETGHFAGDGHHHEFDPHIWTSPVIAQHMVDHIVESLCEADPEHAAYYQENGRAYQQKLTALDQEIRAAVANRAQKPLFFGGTFPFHYFFEEYGLEYEAAYDNCSGETEPSVAVMTRMIREMRREQTPVIYYEELVDPKVARSISEETGAQMLLFHSCHNVSQDDFDQGVTYLSLMQQNLEHLKIGLGIPTTEGLL